jgi:hypothetical protein
VKIQSYDGKVVYPSGAQPGAPAAQEAQ